MSDSKAKLQNVTQPDFDNPVSFLRRLGAILYDGLIVFGLIFLSAQWFPLIPEALQTSAVIRLLKQVYILGIGYAFFGWFWCHSGQTLGMKSWKIGVVNNEGYRINAKQALIRYLVALVSWAVVGLGFFWSIFDRQGRTWHDILSDTYLISTKTQKK